jgi:Uma2 family endonuclease
VTAPDEGAIMRAGTRAAEGFDRRAFTVSEVLRMQEAGIISETERYELIEGEILLMQAKSPTHEVLKSALDIHLARALPDHLWMGFEATVYLSDDTFVEPDIVVYPREFRMGGLKGTDIVLIVEVGASSLSYDLGFKAAFYAKHGVQEYWVVNAATRATTQFSGPRNKTWRRRVERGADELLSHPALPGFSIRLSDYH